MKRETFDSFLTLKELEKHIKYFYDKIYKNQDEIQSLGKQVLAELTKISGWKHMVVNCLSHYEQFPEEFPNWCEYSVANEKLMVEKSYSGCEFSLLFLEVDLNKTLEENVNDAIEKERKKQQEKENTEKEERHSMYLQLKKEFESNE